MKRWLSLLIVFTMFTSTMTTVFGQANDYETNWAKKEIDYMIKKKIILGYPDGTFKPENKISKAEFYKIINNLMGFSEKSQSKYDDVKADDWFYSEVQKGISAGYLLETQSLNANEKITRGEVARIIGKVFHIEESENVAEEFIDSQSLPSEIKGIIGGLKKNGYIHGYSDGTFRHQTEISRAEIVKMLYNISGEIVNQEETISKDVSTNILVNSSNVLLKDMTIEGNLYLTEGIGEGDFTLDNVIVKGNLIIKSGGSNSIKIKNSKINKAWVNKKQGLVRVVFENTSVDQLITEQESKIELTKGTKIKSAQIDGISQIALEKNTKLEKLYANSKDIIIESKGTIESIKTKLDIKVNGKTVKNNSDYKVEDGKLKDTKEESNLKYSSDRDYDDDTSSSEDDEKTYRINFTAGENGTLLATVDDVEVATGNDVKAGKTIKFTARPESEYKLKNWILNDQIIEDNKTNVLTISTTKDLIVTVEFEEDEKEIVEEIPEGTYTNTPQDSGYLQGTESQTYVGLGYNILEKAYFEPSKFERGYNILDEEEVKKYIKKDENIRENPNRYIEGTSLESYSNELATKMNLSAKYPTFSGSIKAEYNMKKTKQSNVHFIKQMNGYIDHSQYLPHSVELKSILDETFKSKLEDMTVSPEDLFKEYGTHLLREVLMGARSTYSYTYSSESEENSSQVKAKIDAAYGYFSGSLSGEEKENTKKFVRNVDVYTVLIGGKYIDASTPDKLAENFPDWVKTLKDYPPDIYGVSSTNSLVPIWKLTDNVERAKELEKYFDESGAILSDWLKEQSKIPDKPSTKEYIESIIITSNKDKEKAKDGSIYKDEGYNIIDRDLNAGAGGEYIYMWYKNTTDPNNALHDIRFTYDKFGDIPSIYTKNNHDLNAGAGGAYIYMWTSKKPKMPGDKPITAINVFFGKNADMPSGYKAAQADWYDKGSKSGKAELNRGAKGEYIYLGYTTK